jgi:hypothetical protein
MHEISTIMADTQVDEIGKFSTTHRLGGLPLLDDKNQVIKIGIWSDFP